MSHRHRKGGGGGGYSNNRGNVSYTNRGGVSSGHNNNNNNNNSNARALNIDIEVSGFPEGCSKNDAKDFLRGLIKNLNCTAHLRDRMTFVTIHSALKNVSSILQTVNGRVFGGSKLVAMPVQEAPINERDQEARKCIEQGFVMDQKMLSLGRVLGSHEQQNRTFIGFMARSIVMFNLDIETLILSENGLNSKSFKNLQPLLEVLPRLKNLSLSGNQLTDLDDLITSLAPVKARLENIILSGNPLVSIDSAQLQLLHDQLGRAFPLLATLDQTPVAKLIRFTLPPNLSNQAPLPPPQGSFIPPGSQPVLELMFQFFTLFDSKDARLTQMYSPSAGFSLSVPKDLRPEDHPTAPIYLRLAGNLEKGSRNKSRTGGQTIGGHNQIGAPAPNATGLALLSNAMLQFPRVVHPSHSFTFDIIQLPELSRWHVNVAGFFLEWEPLSNQHNRSRNAPPLEDVVRRRDFYRSFIILPNGIISNDSLFITTNAPKLSEDELQAVLGGTGPGVGPGSGTGGSVGAVGGMPGQVQLPPVPPQLQGMFSPEETNMIQKLAAEMSISFENAMEALKYTKGDITQAMQVITRAKASGNL